MAAKDANFYKYLEAAFRYRLFNPVGKLSTANTIFRYLGYNLPFKRIFYYARQVLPGFYRNTAEFPNTEEGNLKLARVVLEKLDKHKDLELEYQFKGTLTPEQERLILDQVEVESRQNGAAPEQTVPIGTTTNTSAGSMPFGIPSTGTPSAPRAPRIIIADKTTPPVSGKTGGIGLGTATTNKSSMLEANRVGPATAKAARLQAESRTVSPETTSLPVDNVPKKDLPQGIKGWRAESTAIRQPEPASLSRFNFSAFNSRVSNLAKKVQNFTSPAGPFLKVNLNRVGNGLKNMFGGIGRGIAGPGLTGTANVLGKTGLGAINYGGNFLNNLSNSRLKFSNNLRGAGSVVSQAKSRGGLVFVLGILGFMLLVGGIAISGTTPTGEAAPVTPPGTSPTTPLPPSAPCTSGDYKTCLYDNYKLEFRPGTNISFSADFMQMTYQAMQSAEEVAPKFKNLIHTSCPVITAVPTNTTSHVATCTLNLKPTIGKVAFIHELSHLIYNSDPNKYKDIIKQARVLDASYWEGGFLTYYSKFASSPDDLRINCYPESTGGTYLLDEEFAESITYFINKDDKEINMGSGCSVKWTDVNPYQGGNRYKGHYNLISGILK